MTGQPRGTRTAMLWRIRSILCWVAIAHTIAVAALFVIVPKESGTLGSILWASPAALYVTLICFTFRPGRPTERLVSALAVLLLLGFGWTFGVSALSGFPGGSLRHTALSILVALWLPGMLVIGVARLAMRALRPAAARRDEIDRHRRAEVDYEQRLTREMNQLDRPSAPGRMTGFEPSALEDVDLGDPPLLFGEPGAGLSGSGFSQGAVAAGQAGEMNFARALRSTGALDRFATFWSVHMPAEDVGASAEYSSDIDAVVVTGRRVFLIDVKNYMQGDVTWTIVDDELRMIDNPTGGYVGRARPRTRNMAFAEERVRGKMRRLGIRHSVEATVVFMPTSQGMGELDDVHWPGGVPAVDLESMLALLAKEPDFDASHPDSEHIIRVFRWLVKDASGSAPRPGRVQAARRAQRDQTPAGGTRGPVAPAMPAVSPGTAPAADPDATASQSTSAHNPFASATSSEGASGAPNPPGGGSTQDSDVAGTRTCSECGTVQEPDWTFCWGCGKA